MHPGPPAAPPTLESFFARVCDDPLRGAFEGRRPLVPWLSQRPVAKAELGETWERLRATPRTGGKAVAYFHVPFCSNHCLFCNFYRNATRRNSSAAYVDTIIAELEREAQTALVQSGPVHAVYFGGGTPTDLDAPDLGRLVRAVRRCLPLAGDCEITVEARATGFEEAKIEACLEAGANRFSLGVQTFDTAVRQRLGRRMTGEVVADFVRRLAARDRATVVCDLIYGLPGQTPESWEADLAIATDLGLDGVDLYCLTLIPSSPLAAAIRKGSIEPGAVIAGQAGYYAAGVAALERAGWRQLTSAHFARETRERNWYNQLIKAGAACLAFGSGAGGLVPGYSYLNLPDLARYYETVPTGAKPLAGLFATGPGHGAKGAITGGLEVGRLEPAAVEEAGAPGFMAKAEPLLAQWEEAGLLRREGGALRLTQAGRFWHTNLASALHHVVDSPIPLRAVAASPHSMKPTTDPKEKEIVLEALRTRFKESADGVLEMIAAQSGLTTREVTACLPESCCQSVEGGQFAEVMEELSTWGDILLIVHTADAIIECLAPLPAGSFGRGFFNLGHGSPIRGHIRAERCAEICLVRRPFMGMETCSVQFFNEEGGAMFKIFVTRDEEDVLLPEQVRRFEALQERYRQVEVA